MASITTWAGTVDTALDDLGVGRRPIEETLATAYRAWLRAGLLTDRQAGSLARSAQTL